MNEDMQLAGEQIVYAANDWRSDNRTSSHHIAARLAKNNRLLYVEAAGGRAPRASGRDLRRILVRVGKAFRRPREVSPNIFLFSPLILPFHKYGWVRVLNRRLLQWALRSACRRMGFGRPLVWIVVPHYAPLIDALPAKGIVYYCVDEYASLPNTDRETTVAMEKRILARADVVFTVSDTLWERKRVLNPNTYLNPHGVDVKHFAKALEPSTEIPADIASIPGPIAGFFGLIEEWIDPELLVHVARRLDHISFVFIGRIARDVSKLEVLGNVHFLGQRSYALMPNYLKAFDVGLIPFQLTEVIRNSNPLKFLEYLAGGRPVVTVAIEALAKYGELSYTCGTHEEFADGILRAIDEDCEQRRSARSAAMEGESWDAKFEFVAQHVRKHIAGSKHVSEHSGSAIG